MNPAPRLSWTDIRDRIHARILDGTYAPGDKLPRDADLAQSFECARSTVQRAMQALADRGLVERRRRGGSRVRPDRVTRATVDIPVARIEVERRGGVYGYQLIRRAVEPIPRAVQAAFEMAAPAPMLRVEALHLSDGRPYMLEDRWLCTETVPDILNVDLSRTSANEWLVHNKPYSRCDLRLYAENADDRTARLMDTRPGEALLVIDRTTWIETRPITSVKAVTAAGHRLTTRA